MSPSTVAVDAGQTQTRAALGPGRGSPIATAPGVARLDGAAGIEAVVDPLRRAIAALGPPPPPAAFGIGLSGFETARDQDLRQISELATSELGAATVAIASDGVTSLLGALGDRAGAVVAAGTGTVAVARDGERWAKVDGWGSLLGDAGSGFAIGRAGLDSALREHDGRGGSARLRDAAESAYGDLDDLPRRIHGAASPTSAVAAFAASVARLAAGGDDEARRIIEGSGRELARSVTAALERLFDRSRPVAVSHAGSVFAAGAPLRDPFARALGELWPAAEVVQPQGDALAGAALLAARTEPFTPVPGLVWGE